MARGNLKASVANSSNRTSRLHGEDHQEAEDEVQDADNHRGNSDSTHLAVFVGNRVTLQNSVGATPRVLISEAVIQEDVASLGDATVVAVVKLADRVAHE